MKIAICEDEILFSSLIKKETELFFTEKGISADIETFQDGKNFLLEYENGRKFDIIFMDIGLKDSDGMDTALSVRKFDKKALLIFITGFDNRVIEGYDVNAFNYILKSAIEEKLPETLSRLWDELFQKRALLINDKNSINLVFTDEILGVESMGRGAVIYTYGGTVKTSETISMIAEKLPADLFVECHKSVYVNVEKIKRIDMNLILLENEKTLPVSRRNRKNVMLAVMNRIKV